MTANFEGVVIIRKMAHPINAVSMLSSLVVISKLTTNRDNFNTRNIIHLYRSNIIQVTHT